MHLRRIKPSRSQRTLNSRIGLAKLSDLIPAWFEQNPGQTEAAVYTENDTESKKTTNSHAMVDKSVQLFFPSMSPTNH